MTNTRESIHVSVYTVQFTVYTLHSTHTHTQMHICIILAYINICHWNCCFPKLLFFFPYYYFHDLLKCYLTLCFVYISASDFCHCFDTRVASSKSDRFLFMIYLSKSFMLQNGKLYCWKTINKINFITINIQDSINWIIKNVDSFWNQLRFFLLNIFTDPPNIDYCVWFAIFRLEINIITSNLVGLIVFISLSTYTYYVFYYYGKYASKCKRIWCETS